MKNPKTLAQPKGVLFPRQYRVVKSITHGIRHPLVRPFHNPSGISRQKRCDNVFVLGFKYRTCRIDKLTTMRHKTRRIIQNFDLQAIEINHFI